MKYEPLKGKVYHIPEKGINVFLYSSVKSAVQGLLEEINKEIEEAELEKEGKGYYRFFDNVMTLKRAKSLIKKWFPDVVEEREK